MLKYKDITNCNIDDYIRQERRIGFEKNDPLDRIFWNKEQWIMLNQLVYANGYLLENSNENCEMDLKESNWWFKFKIIRLLFRDKINEENEKEYRRVQNLVDRGKLLRNGVKYMGVKHFEKK